MAEDPFATVMARYERWLSEQRLSAATRRSYPTTSVPARGTTRCALAT
ncbi:MAG: hypothetical protein ACXVHK_28315 [Solirubrobacteraceae bacterium]